MRLLSSSILVLALLAALLAALLLSSCSSCTPGGSRLYQTKPFAPSFKREDVAALLHMGASVVDGGVNFAVYGEHATRIDVLLFDDPDAELPTRQLPMERVDNVWSLF